MLNFLFLFFIFNDICGNKSNSISLLLGVVNKCYFVMIKSYSLFMLMMLKIVSVSHSPYVLQNFSQL